MELTNGQKKNFMQVIGLEIKCTVKESSNGPMGEFMMVNINMMWKKAMENSRGQMVVYMKGAGRRGNSTEKE